MQKLRTVGLIVATLALGSAIALWWRDVGPPENSLPPTAQTQTITATASVGTDSVTATPAAPDDSSVGDSRPASVSATDASASVEPMTVPPRLPAAAGGESNLAALELSSAGPDSKLASAAAPAPRAPDPAEPSFKERPSMVAALSSQSLEDRVHFALDQYKLEDDAVVTLEALIATVADADEILRLVVDGHCDDTGTDQYNQALSEMRAAVVVEFLQRHGLVVREVVTRGFGERVPVVSGRDEKSRAMNRRADIRLDWVSKTPVRPSAVGLQSKN